MDPLWLLLVCLLLAASQAAMLVYGLKKQAAFYERVSAIKLSAPEVTFADLEQVDYEVAQPLAPGQHDHVYGPSPFTEDASSRSYACQVPRCPRVHTIHRGRVWTTSS